MTMTLTETHRAIEAVWRIESARLIAALARRVRDVGLAEELAQDALVSALEQWPRARHPRQPGRLAHGDRQHRAIDQLRRARMLDAKHAQLGHELEMAQQFGDAVRSRRAR